MLAIYMRYVDLSTAPDAIYVCKDLLSCHLSTVCLGLIEEVSGYQIVEFDISTRLSSVYTPMQPRSDHPTISTSLK
jgi:hypothetical protein